MKDRPITGGPVVIMSANVSGVARASLETSDALLVPTALMPPIQRVPAKASCDVADDNAYKSIDEYEEITGIKVNDAFRIGWDMARATMTQLTNLNPLTRSENE